MAIPTKFDHDLAEIDDAMGSVSVCLRTMRHCAAADRARHRAVLPERLQHLVNAVMAAADEIA